MKNIYKERSQTVKEKKLWEYLKKKLSVLHDNNKTAKEIFQYIMKKLN